MKARYSLLALALLFLAGIASAQTITPSEQEVPLTNEDLQSIIDNAQAIQLETAFCTGECVQFSCAHASSAMEELLRTKHVLEQMGFKEGSAGAQYSDIVLNHVESLSDQLQITQEQKSRAEAALGVQIALLAYAEALLKTANLADTVGTAIEKVSKGEADPEGLIEYLTVIDKAIASITDLEDLVNAIEPQEQQHIPDEVRDFYQLKEELTLIKKAMTDSVELKDGLGFVANVASFYAKQDKKERITKIRSLRKEYSAQEKTFENVYEYYRLLSRRRDLVDDALTAVNKAIESLDSCMSEHCKHVPRSAYEKFPEFDRSSQALKYYNGWLETHAPQLEQRADDLRITNYCPDERCKLLPLYQERHRLVNSVNSEQDNIIRAFTPERHEQALRNLAAKLSAINKRITPYDPQPGIVVAPYLENVAPALERGTSGWPTPGCPYHEGFGISQRHQVIDDLEQGIVIAQDAPEFAGKLKQWEKDLQGVKASPERVTEEVTEELDEEELLSALRTTALSLREELRKWRQEISFIRQAVADKPSLADPATGVMERFEQTFSDVNSSLQNELQDLRATWIMNVLVRDETLKGFKDTQRAINDDLRELRTKVKTLICDDNGRNCHLPDNIDSIKAQIEALEQRKTELHEKIIPTALADAIITRFPHLTDDELLDLADRLNMFWVKDELGIGFLHAKFRTIYEENAKARHQTVTRYAGEEASPEPVRPPSDEEEDEDDKGGDGKIVDTEDEEEDILFEFPSEYGPHKLNPLTGRAYQYHPETLAHLPGQVRLGKRLDYEDAPESFLQDKDRDGLTSAPTLQEGENTWAVIVSSDGAASTYLNLLIDIDQDGQYGDGDWLVQNQEVNFKRPGTQEVQLIFTIPLPPRPELGLMTRISITEERAQELDTKKGSARAFPSNTQYAPLYLVQDGESETYLARVRTEKPANLQEGLTDIARFKSDSAINQGLPDFAKRLLGTNTINLYLTDGDAYVLTTIDGDIQDVRRGSSPDASLEIETSQETIENILRSQDPAQALLEAIKDKDIHIDHKGLWGTLKGRLSIAKLKVFGA